MSETPVATAPAAGLSRAEVRRGLRISIVEGAFANSHLVLAGGMFLTGLALHLGARPFHIGLLAAIPALVSVVALAAGSFVRRAGSRRGLTVWTSGAGRATFIVLVPFLLLKLELGLGLFFAVVLVYNVLLAFAGTTWNSWMSDLVPEDSRGRFFGRRNAILGGIGMVLTFGAGRAMDWVKTHDPDLGYGLAYLLAVALGVVSALLLSRQPEPPLVPRPHVPLRERLFGPLVEERQFRRLIVFIGVWFLTCTMASPFYMAHLLTNLRFSFTSVGVYAILGGTTGILFQLFWGWHIDRFGPKPAAVVSFAFVGVMPLLWVFATPTFRLPIWIDGVLNGLFWTGANLGLVNLLFALGDNPVRKESYFAIYGVVVGLATFVASLAGGAIAQALAGFRLELFGHTYVNYHLLFLVSGLARFACLPLLVRIQERRSRTVVRTVQVLGTYALNRLNYNKEVFLHAFRARPRDRRAGRD